MHNYRRTHIFYLIYGKLQQIASIIFVVNSYKTFTHNKHKKKHGWKENLRKDPIFSKKPSLQVMHNYRRTSKFTCFYLLLCS